MLNADGHLRYPHTSYVNSDVQAQLSLNIYKFDRLLENRLGQGCHQHRGGSPGEELRCFQLGLGHLHPSSEGMPGLNNNLCGHYNFPAE